MEVLLIGLLMIFPEEDNNDEEPAFAGDAAPVTDEPDGTDPEASPAERLCSLRCENGRLKPLGFRAAAAAAEVAAVFKPPAAADDALYSSRYCTRRRSTAGTRRLLRALNRKTKYYLLTKI